MPLTSLTADWLGSAKTGLSHGAKSSRYSALGIWCLSARVRNDDAEWQELVPIGGCDWLHILPLSDTLGRGSAFLGTAKSYKSWHLPRLDWMNLALGLQEWEIWHILCAPSKTDTTRGPDQKVIRVCRSDALIGCELQLRLGSPRRVCTWFREWCMQIEDECVAENTSDSVLYSYYGDPWRGCDNSSWTFREGQGIALSLPTEKERERSL